VLKRKTFISGGCLKNSYISRAYVFERKLACATLRDTLLPRLISGQLRLPEARAATEVALGGVPQA
jgi:type I restriction enzyme S subunit